MLRRQPISTRDPVDPVDPAVPMAPPTEEAHADLAAASRRVVPMREVLGVAADFARRTGPADPGFLGQV